MNSSLLSVDEVAAYLNVHRDTVYKLIRDGRLPALQLGGRKAGWRIGREDLEQFIQKGKSATQDNSGQGAMAAFEEKQAEDLRAFQESQQKERASFLHGHPSAGGSA